MDDKLDKIDVRLDHTVQEIKEAHEAQLSNMMGTMDDKLARTASAVQSIDARLDDKLASIDARLDDKLDKIDERLEKMETAQQLNMSAMDRKLNTMRKKV